MHIINTLLKELTVSSSSHKVFPNLVMSRDYHLYLDNMCVGVGGCGDKAGYLSSLFI